MQQPKWTGKATLTCNLLHGVLSSLTFFIMQIAKITFVRFTSFLIILVIFEKTLF